MLDGAAIGDVDYTAAAVLARVIQQLQQRHIRLVVSSLLSPVREQLGRYGINAAPGSGAYYDTPGEALEAFRVAGRPGGPSADGRACAVCSCGISVRPACDARPAASRA